MFRATFVFMLMVLAGCADSAEPTESEPAAVQGAGEPAPTNEPLGAAPELLRPEPFVLRWNETYADRTGTQFTDEMIVSRNVTADIGLPGLPKTIVVERRCSNVEGMGLGTDPSLRFEASGTTTDGGGASSGFTAGGPCSGVRADVTGAGFVEFAKFDELIVGASVSLAYVGASADLEFAVSVFWDKPASESYSAFA